MAWKWTTVIGGSHFLFSLLFSVVAIAIDNRQGPHIIGYVLVGIVFAQSCLLAVWSTLGTSAAWIRVLFALIAVSYLGLLLGWGIDELNLTTLFMVALVYFSVAIPLFVGRHLRFRVCRDDEQKMANSRLQFGIRHMMLAMVGVGVALSVGKLFGFPAPIRDLPFLLGVAVPFIFTGVLATWAVLLWSHFLLGSAMTLVLATGSGLIMGHCLGRGRDSWPAATAAEAVVLVVTFLVLRVNAFRVKRLPIKEQPRQG
jgi:hypothetical protein